MTYGVLPERCDCCKKPIAEKDYDFTYCECHDCAWCASLEHFPCCHGACKDENE